MAKILTIECGDDGVVAVLEGDGSNDPAVLPSLVGAIGAGADVVIASRFLPGGGTPGFPPARRLLSRSLALLLRAAGLSARVTDGSIFYRAYRASFLRRAVDTYGERLVTAPGFAANTELLVNLLRLGARVDEVPLTYGYHLKKSDSKIRVRREILDQLRLVGRVWRGGARG